MNLECYVLFSMPEGDTKLQNNIIIQNKLKNVKNQLIKMKNNKYLLQMSLSLINLSVLIKQ